MNYEFTGLIHYKEASAGKEVSPIHLSWCLLWWRMERKCIEGETRDQT